jgi:hypothetical protein
MKNFSKEISRLWLKKPICYIFGAWFLISMTGCASVGQTRYTGPEIPIKAENGWWYAGFQFNWPEGVEPAWHDDLLIAHRIVAPVLSRYRNDISLWRFHRRAVQDQAGHRFSFIFYSTPDTARKVFESIKSTDLLEELKSAGVLVKDSYDDTSKITRPNIENTSDGHWSQPVQKSWPYFIMGVSEMWLDLITQFAQDGRRQPSSIEEMRSFYLEIDKAVLVAWEKEGSHAFLHHLNAIFGYNPLIIHQKFLMTF